MEKKTLSEYVKEYWFMIVFIGMVIVSWSTFSGELKALENRVTELERVIVSFEQVRVDIAVIKEKISNIEEKI